MIKINLTPVDELENKYWYLPDAIFAASVLLVAWLGTNLYLSLLQQDIDDAKVSIEEIQRNTQRLAPDLERHDQLTKQVNLLREKIKILTNLTASKIERYKPVILLEQLQNLYPKGLWFSHLAVRSEASIINIDGGAFDTLLIAEFMSNLEATKSQNADSSDIRTYLYFSKVFLEKVTNGDYSPTSKKDGEENLSEKQKTFASNKTDKELKGDSSDSSNSTAQRFPEISDFPVFNLNVRYAERTSAVVEDVPKTKIGM